MTFLNVSESTMDEGLWSKITNTFISERPHLRPFHPWSRGDGGELAEASLGETLEESHTTRW